MGGAQRESAAARGKPPHHRIEWTAPAPRAGIARRPCKPLLHEVARGPASAEGGMGSTKPNLSGFTYLRRVQGAFDQSWARPTNDKRFRPRRRCVRPTLERVRPNLGAVSTNNCVRSADVGGDIDLSWAGWTNFGECLTSTGPIGPKSKWLGPKLGWARATFGHIDHSPRCADRLRPVRRPSIQAPVRFSCKVAQPKRL